MRPMNSKMNRYQNGVIAAGAVALGAAFVARSLRAARSIDFNGRSVVITGGVEGSSLASAGVASAPTARKAPSNRAALKNVRGARATKVC